MSDIKLYAQFIAEQSQKTQLTDKLEAVKNMKENYEVAMPVYHPNIRGHEIGNITKKGGKFHAETYSNKGSSSSIHNSKREAEESVIQNHLRNTAKKTTNEAAYTPNTTRMIDPQPDKEKMAAQAAKSPEQRRKEAKTSVRQGLQNTVNQAKEKGRFAFTKKARSALRDRVNIALNAARSRNVSANQVK